MGTKISKRLGMKSFFYHNSTRFQWCLFLFYIMGTSLSFFFDFQPLSKVVHHQFFVLLLNKLSVFITSKFGNSTRTNWSHTFFLFSHLFQLKVRSRMTLIGSKTTQK